MAKLIVENQLKKYDGQPITLGILKETLREYQRPHNKIRELEKQEVLTPVKRGLYILGPALRNRTPPNYTLANHIYGPSYVSFEAALSYWGLIPEMVATIASMTTGSTKDFRTPVGLFQYRKAKLPYYSFGIRMVESAPDQVILIASPEKAICDIIVTRSGLILRSITQALEFLEEDLRIEREALQALDIQEMETWIEDAPKKKSLQMLIKTLKTL